MTTRTLAVLLVLLFLVSFALGQTTVQSSFFGMHTSSRQDWPAALGALGKAPSTAWEYVETSKGVYDWSTLDLWVSESQKYGVSFFFSNNGMPAWAVRDKSQCTPASGTTVLKCYEMVTNIQDWDDWIAALATRYKGKLIYELWNEPFISPGYLTVDDMVTLTTHAYNTIRAIDPGAQILCCGFKAFNNFEYMDQFFAAGGLTGADAISFHGNFRPQANGLVPPPEWTSTMVDNVRQILSKYGLASKPLWDTEGGWWWQTPPSASGKPPFIAKWYLLQQSKGVVRAYWFQWDAVRPLWASTTGINPAGIAYVQVYNWTVGATVSRACGLRADGTTWTCSFTRGGGYVGKVIWDTVGKQYKPGTLYTQYRDLSGKTVPLIPGKSLTIGPSPIILENFTP